MSTNIASMNKKELGKFLKAAGCHKIKIKRKIKSDENKEDFKNFEFVESEWQKRKKPYRDEMG